MFVKLSLLYPQCVQMLSFTTFKATPLQSSKGWNLWDLEMEAWIRLISSKDAQTLWPSATLIVPSSKFFSLIPDNRHPCRHWDGAQQGSTLISSREAEPRTLPQFSIKVILLWSFTNVIIITKRSPAAVAPLFEDWGRQLLRHLYGAIPPPPHDANQLL